MATVTLHESIRIAASAEVVFAAMTDWSRQSEWMVGTSVKTIHNEGKGVGAKIIARTAFGPFGLNDQMTITQWQPPLRCAVLHTGRVVRGSGVFTVEPVDAATSLFIWSEDTELPFGIVGLAGWQVLKLPIGLGLRRSLHRFKRWIER